MTTHDTHWTEQKGRLQVRWPALTDADLDSTGGEREALLGLMEARLGYAVGNAEEDLDEILAGDVVVPRDVADEEMHTGTSGPVPGPTTWYDSASWKDRVQPAAWDDSHVGDGAGRSETQDSADLGYPKDNYPHRVPSGSGTRGTARPIWISTLVAAISSALGAAVLLYLQRRSRQKRLRIELQIPVWPVPADRARDVAYEAIDLGREHTASMLESAAHRVQHDNQTRDGLQGVATKTAAGSMQEAAGYLREHEAAEIWGGVAGYVKHHPGRTALVAVAAGIVAGRMLR